MIYSLKMFLRVAVAACMNFCDAITDEQVFFADSLPLFIPYCKIETFCVRQNFLAEGLAYQALG